MKISPSVRLIASLAAFSVVGASHAGKSSKYDHFTKWQPPTASELPPEAKVITIVPGDTLWDLAQTHLGDPYFWPQLWEVNPYIGDPHWIYPGDPLVIPQPAVISESGLTDEAFPYETLPPPRPVAKRIDVYCAPYVLPVESKVEVAKTKPEKVRMEPNFEDAAASLTRADEAAAAPGGRVFRGGQQEEAVRGGGHSGADATASASAPSFELVEPPIDGTPMIGASESERIDLSVGDIVYINRGESHGVSAGDEFFAVRAERTVIHPGDGSIVGMAMQMVGSLKVICTQQRTATAVITDACLPLGVGDLIRPLEPIPIPLASEFEETPRHCAALPDRATGSIVHSRFTKSSLGPEDLVNIDLGSAAGIVPGDFLTIYRTNRLGSEYPDTVLGDLVILLVEEKTATAKIMASWIDVAIGDHVRLR